MGWLLNLFGSPGKAMDMVHDAGSFIGDQYDKSKFTPQEISEDYQKRRDNWLELQKMAFNQNSLSSVTRRMTNYIVMIPYMGLIVLGAVSYKFDPEWSRYILNIVDTTFWLPMAIVSFYFGPHEFQKLGFFKGKS